LGGNDVLAGARGLIDGSISGGTGNDSMSSGLADDTLGGDSGNDTLRGNAGDDRLSGGTGTDRLRGGTGDDLLTGGAGVDVFLFSLADGIDRIADFTNGQDLLGLTELSVSSFTALSAEARNRPGGLLIDLRDFGGGTVFLTGMTKAPV
jgi:Ca2+-binding RTX toxin-like protein